MRLMLRTLTFSALIAVAGCGPEPETERNLENQADQIHRKLLAMLFNGKYEAIEVLKLKQIVDVLEEAADAFEHVANTVETIAVKES